MTTRLCGGLLAAACGLMACSPTFNWRELRQDGTPLVALMPCKPDKASRPVPLAGTPTELHMASCDTGGQTFAVSWVELGDAARAPALLSQWPRAALSAIRAEPAQAQPWAARVAGASQTAGLMAQGVDGQGRAVQMRAAWFTRGTQVFQAAIYGPALNDEVSATFFDGLQLP